MEMYSVVSFHEELKACILLLVDHVREFVFLHNLGVFVCSVQNPGKCQSSTFSTYTFTTCRILHPSDITQVTPR